MTGSGISPERPRGVLDTQPDQQQFRLSLRKVAPALIPFVSYYWLVTWDLRGRAPHEQRVLPDPAVHLVFADDHAQVSGVVEGLYSYVLRDTGRILGVRFRPGGFHPFLRAPASTLTNRSVDIRGLFEVGEGTVQAVLNAHDDDAMVARVDRFLTSVLPDREPTAEAVGRMVEWVADQSKVTRVDEFARQFGVSVRRLQRLFAEYVGVGPKWVIRRYRLREAAERVASGAEASWGRLATDLGYYDQAHFTRDFAATIGMTPARYARYCTASISGFPRDADAAGPPGDPARPS